MTETKEELKERIVVHVLASMINHPHPAEIQVFIDRQQWELYGYHNTLGRDLRDQFQLYDHSAVGDVELFSMACIIEVHRRALIRFRRALFSLK